MSPEKNRKFSVLPIPLFIGLPGFMEKFWMDNENTGYSQGIYQWKSKEHAEVYAGSFAFGFMKKRSEPNSITYEIIENKNIDTFINELSTAPAKSCSGGD